MGLLIIRPADAHPQSRQFDGPVSLALALALMIEGAAEEVPGFTSISQQGVVRRCAAYCAENAKKNGVLVNSTATALWHAALKRQGIERGLRRSDGTIADWLAGAVVVELEESPAYSNQCVRSWSLGQCVPPRGGCRSCSRPRAHYLCAMVTRGD
jgi:hypothetical protein